MRGWSLAVALLLVLAAPPASSQSQPLVPPDFSLFLSRENLTEAGETAGAVRVLRFVQVSDAHILDDDAPYPLRQENLDPFGGPFTAAQRPQEEYTDEVLDSIIQAINSLHAEDGLDLVINTGDNIDNELENELMRFVDNWEGTTTTVGPVSGLECIPDGQSTGTTDTAHDVADRCTSLPEALAANNTPLAPGLPWLSAFGNHDGLIQGNVPVEPGFNDIAGQSGRRFLTQPEYVGMHFATGGACAAGVPAGTVDDDFGHGYGYALDRLCDGDPDNDGYYAFSLRGVRFVVLDTVNDDFVTSNTNLQGLFNPQASLGYDLLGGYAEGSVDPAQFGWLVDEIENHPDELVLVFSHHTVNSMFTDSAANPCGPPGCLADLLTGAGYKTGPELVAAMSAYPNMVAWIGGHTHRHRIEPKQVVGAPSAGFWNVETASLIDMPQEARAIEVWVTADRAKGFLLLKDFGHSFNASRDLALTDPQADPAAGGVDTDRDTLLWFDLAPGLGVIPMPEPARDWQITMEEPLPDADGRHGEPGSQLSFAFAFQDALHPDASVPEGLTASWGVVHQPPGGAELAQVDVVDGTPLDLVPGNGTARAQAFFTPPDAATYYVTVSLFRNATAEGGAATLLQLEPFRVRVGDADVAEVSGESSPATPVPLALLALAVAALGLRQKR